MMHIAPVDFVSVMTSTDPDSKAKCWCEPPKHKAACPRFWPTVYAEQYARHKAGV